MTSLEALDSGRAWRKRSVDSRTSLLRERCLVRRIKKSQNTEPAVYVRVGVDVPIRPFEDMTPAEGIKVVNTGSMTLYRTPSP